MKRLLCASALIASCFAAFGQPVPPRTTVYTRDLLLSSDAAEARTKLGVGTNGAGGLASINGIASATEPDQLLVIGTAGTTPAISSASDTHTINLPASAYNRNGVLNSNAWSRHKHLMFSRYEFFDDFERDDTTNGWAGTHSSSGHAFFLQGPALLNTVSNIGRISGGRLVVDLIPESGPTNGNIYYRTTLSQAPSVMGGRFVHLPGTGAANKRSSFTMAASSTPSPTTALLHLRTDAAGAVLSLTTNGFAAGPTGWQDIGVVAWSEIPTNGEVVTVEMTFLGDNWVLVSARGTNGLFNHPSVDHARGTNVFYQIGGAQTNLTSKVELEAIWAGNAGGALPQFDPTQFGIATNGQGVYHRARYFIRTNGLDASVIGSGTLQSAFLPFDNSDELAGILSDEEGNGGGFVRKENPNISNVNLLGTVRVDDLVVNSVLTLDGTGHLAASPVSPSQLITADATAQDPIIAGIVALSDPNAHRLMGWDDTDNLPKFITIGTGLSYDDGTDTLTATAGGAIPDLVHADHGFLPGTTNISGGSFAMIDFFGPQEIVITLGQSIQISVTNLALHAGTNRTVWVTIESDDDYEATWNGISWVPIGGGAPDLPANSTNRFSLTRVGTRLFGYSGILLPPTGTGAPVNEDDPVLTEPLLIRPQANGYLGVLSSNSTGLVRFDNGINSQTNRLHLNLNTNTIAAGQVFQVHSVTHTTSGTDVTVTNKAVSGTGDVVGPASSTDNAIAVFDGTGGKTLKNSAVTIGGNDVTVPGDVAAASVTVTGNGGLIVSDGGFLDGTIEKNGGTFYTPNALTGTGGALTNFVAAAYLEEQTIAVSTNVSLTIMGWDSGGPVAYPAIAMKNTSGSNWPLHFSSVSNQWTFAGVYGTNAPSVLTNGFTLYSSSRVDGTNILFGYTYGRAQ